MNVLERAWTEKKSLADQTEQMTVRMIKENKVQSKSFNEILYSVKP